MIFPRSGDHGNGNIAHVVEGVGLIDEVIMKELGCDMISFGWIVGDVFCLEGQGNAKEANKDGGLGLSSGHGEGCFKDFLRVFSTVRALGHKG
jgi:hypothetical protein